MGEQLAENPQDGDIVLPIDVRLIVREAVDGMRKAVAEVLDELAEEADAMPDLFVVLPRNGLIAAAMKASGWTDEQIGAAMDAAGARAK